MSIGIAVPIEDGVVLIADSRSVWIARDGEAVEGDPVSRNDHRKITLLDERVAVISFGIVEVNDETINVLRQVWPPSTEPMPMEMIVTLLDLSLARVWGSLNFDPRLDLSGPEHVAGFAVGGISAEGPFVALVLRSRSESFKRESSADPRARIVIASEAGRAQQIYLRNEKSESALANIGSASLEELKQAILRAAEKTVREVSSYDPSVGGIARYTIISIHPPNVSEGVCVQEA